MPIRVGPNELANQCQLYLSHIPSLQREGFAHLSDCAEAIVLSSALSETKLAAALALENRLEIAKLQTGFQPVLPVMTKEWELRARCPCHIIHNLTQDCFSIAT